MNYSKLGKYIYLRGAYYATKQSHWYKQLNMGIASVETTSRSILLIRSAPPHFVLGMYPPQVRHEDALLRVSPLSAHAEGFEDAARLSQKTRRAKREIATTHNDRGSRKDRWDCYRAGIAMRSLPDGILRDHPCGVQNDNERAVSEFINLRSLYKPNR